MQFLLSGYVKSGSTWCQHMEQKQRENEKKHSSEHCSGAANQVAESTLCGHFRASASRHSCVWPTGNIREQKNPFTPLAWPKIGTPLILISFLFFSRLSYLSFLSPSHSFSEDLVSSAAEQNLTILGCYPCL